MASGPTACYFVIFGTVCVCLAALYKQVRGESVSECFSEYE